MQSQTTTQYRLTRAQDASEQPGEADANADTVDLATFKSAEYWFRLVRCWPCRYQTHMHRLHMARGAREELLEFARECAGKGNSRRRRNRRPRWTLLLRRKARRPERGDQDLGDYLEMPEVASQLRPRILKVAQRSLLELAAMPPSPHDQLGERLDHVCEALKLGPVEREIVLYAYLCRSHRDVTRLHEIVEEEDGRKLGPHHVSGPSYRALAVLTGCSLQQVQASFATSGSLQRLGIIDNDGDLDLDIQSYLSAGGEESLIAKHFRIHRGPVIPLEEHAVPETIRELLLEMLRTHAGERPLHILLHGVEGAGKSEFCRSLGRAAGRTVIETGLANGVEESGSRFKEAEDRAVRYGLRSLRLAANHAMNGEPSLIVMDEADVFLNCAEKGRLNMLMEEVRAPVVWISNSLECVERSTLRRFDYSVAFRGMGERQRREMWTRVARKHGAEELVSPELVEEFARRFPVVAGGIDLAVRNALALSRAGSALPPARAMESVLQSHVRLLDLRPDSHESSSRSPAYSLEGLNVSGGISGAIRTAEAFSARWRGHDTSKGPCNLSMLLYGPPGTGKTEFARHLSRVLERPLCVRRGSDLLGMYVGQTEKNIRQAFEQAAEEGAILFLDEADGLLQNRENAHRSWEVTQVNELLTRMEDFTGLLVCATNFMGNLDPASRRRFHLKLEFGYLKGDGARRLWDAFFAARVRGKPDEEFFGELRAVSLLAPGDFKAVHERLRYFSPDELTPESVLAALRDEVAFKDGRVLRRLGLQEG